MIGAEIDVSDALGAFDRLTPALQRSILRALNKAAPWARTRLDRKTRDQVAFPASYLRPSEGRLRVTRKASAGSLEAVVEGRDRPTALSRFLVGGRRKNGGLVVQVKPGQRRTIERAFLVKLNRGSTQGKDLSYTAGGERQRANVGLAVRTSGGPPRGAHKPTEIFPNVFLLYGPTVAQALFGERNEGGVIREVEPEALTYYQDELLRLLELEDA